MRSSSVSNALDDALTYAVAHQPPSSIVAVINFPNRQRASSPLGKSEEEDNDETIVGSDVPVATVRVLCGDVTTTDTRPGSQTCGPSGTASSSALCAGNSIVGSPVSILHVTIPPLHSILVQLSSSAAETANTVNIDVNIGANRLPYSAIMYIRRGSAMVTGATNTNQPERHPVTSDQVQTYEATNSQGFSDIAHSAQAKEARQGSLLVYGPTLTSTGTAGTDTTSGTVPGSGHSGAAVVGDGAVLEVTAGSRGLDGLLLLGKPLEEPALFDGEVHAILKCCVIYHACTIHHAC